MILLDFLSDNIIITNTYNIFDYDTFKNRFIARYGQREIRADVTAEQIIAISQNTVDINKDFYKSLFTHILDPFKTWGENSSSSGSVTVNTTNNEKTDYTTTDKGTNTTNSGGDSTTTTENNSTTNNARNAYNSSTASPTDTSTNTNGGTTSNTYGDLTTVTNDTTTTNGGTKNNTINGTTTDNNNGNKTGWTNADALNTMREYTAAYDVIIDNVAENILSAFINIWG